jgi:gliding motility-associated-like protein
MLPYFSRILINKYIYKVFFICLMVFACSYQSRAQSFGDPIIHITFGSGIPQFAGALKADSGFTDYAYVDKSPEDNQYTIATTTRGLNPAWVITSDHSGMPTGYMMIVNASYLPGLFYTRRVDGLCGSTTYQFSAFIKNILAPDKRGILPNISFKIETVAGQFLGGGTTGDIVANDTWLPYPFTFSTPANTQTVVIKMINNAPGGGGNDIAIDDIMFRPAGSELTVQSDQNNGTFCAATPQTITIKTTTALDPNFAQKLQVKINGVWIDQSTAGTDSNFSFSSPTTAGSYSYRVVKSDAGNINTSSCVVASNFLDITVLPSPVAVFDATDVTCEGAPITFTDKSTMQGANIASWLWDFGDGQTSTEQNPTHMFGNVLDPVVKLTVKSIAGCESIAATKTIHVIPKVNISFTASTPACENQAVTFTDGSTSAEGSIISRAWDYGDGVTETKTDNLPFTHTYTTAATYPVKLTITTDKGCATTFTRDVIVQPLPKVDFDLPEVCYADLLAKFTDKTTVSDGSALTYLWDFGDNKAGPGNLNTSTLQNPSHYFSETSHTYQITLTVTSANGCVNKPMIKTLQVNGSPIPDFEPITDQPLCANREVFFKNTSSATIGKPSKIVIYYNADDPSVPPETDNDPYPGKLYRHIYPALHYPQTQQVVNVKMVTFTGDAGICQESKTKQITLLPTPVLSFTPPDEVCLNNGPINLDNFTKETTGIPGAAFYSGAGVTGKMFDPAVAGVGTIVLKCVYTTTALTACADTLTRSIIIKPIPVVNAGPDVTILAGTTTMLNATATGDNLKYAWTPATGLSNSTIPNPVATVDQNITYTLTVTNGEDCSVTDKVNIIALQVPVVPNTFTPNGDGINDTWNIQYLNTYVDCTVDIFSRNGQKVFRSVGYATAWDGRINGNDLPVGVYYYIIDPKHGRKPVSGYVTIIR